MKKIILSPIGMLIVGFFLGALSRWLDLNTQNLGNVFSRLAVWILFGTLISVMSDTNIGACVNVLCFCAGMLVTYYFVMLKVSGYFFPRVIFGWTVFALLSPIMALAVRVTKSRGALPCAIRVGIVAAAALSSLLLFGGYRVYDVLIDAVIVCVLYRYAPKKETA